MSHADSRDIEPDSTPDRRRAEKEPALRKDAASSHASPEPVKLFFLKKPAAESSARKKLPLEDPDGPAMTPTPIPPASEEGAADLAKLRSEGIRLYRNGETTQAVAVFDRCLALHPRHAKTLGNRSEALRSLGRHDEALADAEAAIAADEGYHVGYLRKASALLELHRFDEAAAAATAGLQRDPMHPGLLKVQTAALSGREEAEAATRAAPIAKR